MQRVTILSVGGFLIIGGALGLLYLQPSIDPAPKTVVAAERSPICPWRDPERDLALLFPQATTHVAETRIVSGRMAELQKQLGRPLEPDENPLRVYRARKMDTLLGSVIVRRVKGEHGGIEIVMGVDRHGEIVGVLIQSHREPAAIASAITNTSWLEAFRGKTADARVRPGEDLPEVPTAADQSARAIADGVRAHLIVLRTAEKERQAAAVEGQVWH